MNICPCCSNILLRHFKENQVVWFCRNCWQSMPVLDEKEGYFSSTVVALESMHQKSSDRPQWKVYSAVRLKTGDNLTSKQASKS
jgi:DNA-directed RNA polymerase subunit M/transcription elongation factor TFIIS